MRQFTYGIGLLVVLLIVACSSKKVEKDTNVSADPDFWPEMASFHKVMAEAYHPYADSKNLEPIKSLAGNLARESEKWAAATLPEKMNNDEIKGKLDILKTDSRKLADLVKSGASDDQIGSTLAALHEQFHSIMEQGHGRRKP